MRLFVLLAITCAALYGQQSRTENVVLITADGLRWQEVFRGVDPMLAEAETAGMKGADAIRKRFVRGAQDESRQALMPYFWTELVPNGVVLGNRDAGNTVELANSRRVSYPGYSELLTGRTQDDVIRGNDKVQNPVPTILEFARERQGWDFGKTALFASWGVFRWIGETEKGSVLISAGLNAEFPERLRTARIDELLGAQARALPQWGEIRFDYFTVELAKEYLRSARPRLLHIALTETDDWAHSRRYDRTLQMAHFVDESLRDLWLLLMSIPQYAGKTTVIVTSDHGRGSTLDDWHSHGGNIDGAEYIWIAARGPDTPAQGVSNGGEVRRLQDVAPTILQLLGIDTDAYDGVAGSPIPEIAGPQSRHR